MLRLLKSGLVASSTFASANILIRSLLLYLMAKQTRLREIAQRGDAGAPTVTSTTVSLLFSLPYRSTICTIDRSASRVSRGAPLTFLTVNCFWKPISPVAAAGHERGAETA